MADWGPMSLILKLQYEEIIFLGYGIIRFYD